MFFSEPMNPCDILNVVKNNHSVLFTLEPLEKWGGQGGGPRVSDSHGFWRLTWCAWFFLRVMWYLFCHLLVVWIFFGKFLLALIFPPPHSPLRFQLSVAYLLCTTYYCLFIMHYYRLFTMHCIVLNDTKYTACKILEIWHLKYLFNTISSLVLP